MSHRKYWIIPLVIVVAALLCAFTLLPSLRLASDDGDVEVKFLKAERSGNTLSLFVNYDSHGRTFEICKDIEVFCDKEKTLSLQPIQCTINGKQYKYDYLCTDSIKQLYVASPIVYVIKDISPIAFTVSKDTVIYNHSGDRWLLVDNVSVNECETGFSKINVTVIPQTNDLPRAPKLVTDNAILESSTAHFFDKEFNSTSCEMSFILPYNLDTAQEYLDGGQLVISQVLSRVDSANNNSDDALVRLAVTEGE